VFAPAGPLKPHTDVLCSRRRRHNNDSNMRR
jgi:hypothetical protein